MKYIYLIIIILLAGCSSLYAREAPHGTFSTNGKTVSIASLGGCWENIEFIDPIFFFSLNSTSCRDVSLNYEHYTENSNLVIVGDTAIFAVPLRWSIESVLYSIQKLTGAGELQPILSSTSDGSIEIDTTNLGEGIYVLDVFVNWSGRRDAYYVYGFKVKP